MLCWFSSCKGVISRPHKMLVTSNTEASQTFQSSCALALVDVQASWPQTQWPWLQSRYQFAKIDLSRCQGRIDNGLNHIWIHKIQMKWNNMRWMINPPDWNPSIWEGQRVSTVPTPGSAPPLLTGLKTKDFRHGFWLEGEQRTSCKVTWRSTTSMYRST